MGRKAVRRPETRVSEAGGAFGPRKRRPCRPFTLAFLLVALLALAGSPAAQAQEAPLCNGLTATIVGSDGDDILEGTAGSDVIQALGGNDSVVGNEGDDVICGGDGRDVIQAGPGDDIANGWTGNDLIAGHAGGDLLYGVFGNDRIVGGPGPDEMAGGRGRDRIDGGGGKDWLYGGPDDDLVSGGIARDVLSGGDGGDVLKGNAGVDTLFDRNALGDDTLDGGLDLALCRAAPTDTLINCVTLEDVHAGLITLGQGIELLEGVSDPAAIEDLIDLEEALEVILQSDERVLGTLAELSKALHDLAQAIVRKIGG